MQSDNSISNHSLDHPTSRHHTPHHPKTIHRTSNTILIYTFNLILRLFFLPSPADKINDLPTVVHLSPLPHPTSSHPTTQDPSPSILHLPNHTEASPTHPPSRPPHLPAPHPHLYSTFHPLSPCLLGSKDRSPHSLSGGPMNSLQSSIRSVRTR